MESLLRGIGQGGGGGEQGKKRFSRLVVEEEHACAMQASGYSEEMDNDMFNSIIVQNLRSVFHNSFTL